MASEWAERTTFAALIEEGALEIGDGYRAKNEELGGNGPIFLRAGHVTDSHIDFSGVERFDIALEPRVCSKLSRPGDAVVTTKGNSTGRTTFVTPSMPPFVYSPHLSYWRTRDPDRLEGGFLRYWSKGPEFSEQLTGMKASTDMAPYLSLIDQKQLKISLPPVEQQRAIAHILGTLDDKTELNRRMNETLEAMARALFKSWFVDFGPVRAKIEGGAPGLAQPVADLFPDSVEESELGKIPKGWRVGTLGEVADHPRRGRRPSDIDPSTPYIALEHMPRRCIALSDWGTAGALASGKFAFSQREILFGKLRPYFHKVGVAPVDGVCSTDIVVVAPKHPQWLGFVLGHLSSDAFVEFANAGSTGTRMPRTSWGEMGKYRVVLPPDGVAAAFTSHAQPLVDRIIANILQSHLLIGLRDTLLPNLISGELRIRDAESLAGLRETTAPPAQPRQRSARALQPTPDTPLL